MKLHKVQVAEFQSITDSCELDLDRVTCLVGKNESGKTAILQALYRLNPMIQSEGQFDVVFDYPKRSVTEYERDVARGSRDAATVTTAHFALEDPDLIQVVERFGSKVLTEHTLVLHKGYSNALDFELKVDKDFAFRHVIASADITEEQRELLSSVESFDEALVKAGDLEETQGLSDLKRNIAAITGDLDQFIWESYLQDRVPRFLYFSDYYQLTGAVNLPSYAQRRTEGKRLGSDYPMEGLLALAGVTAEDFQNPQSTQKLKNQLRGASNFVHDKVMKYWSQNRHLSLEIDVRPGLPGDPDGFRTGNNVWAEVFDDRHRAVTELGSRSKGFVWFFSFIAWYETLRDANIILLLDEPGLSLHGRAQADLLRYIDKELAPAHQVLYTTHSPFMIDARKFEQVRIVQDRGMDLETRLPPEEDGTKVLQGFLDANDDSLFPFHGAAGFDVFQTLFLGPNSLVVEGKSDLLYLQAMTVIAQEKGQSGLSPLWTVTPTGGDGRVYSVASILAAQRGLNVALLLDRRKQDQRLAGFKKDNIVSEGHVITYGEALGAQEADVEDMFPPDLYIELVNRAYAAELTSELNVQDLNDNVPRMAARLSAYFEDHPLRGAKFSHYPPARVLVDNLAEYAPRLEDVALERFATLFESLNALL